MSAIAIQVINFLAISNLKGAPKWNLSISVT